MTMRHASYCRASGPDGTQEWDAFTCVHCQAIVRIAPRASASASGGWCGRCNQPICGPCAATGQCTPWEKQMERIEARDRFLRSAGLLLIVVMLAFSTPRASQLVVGSTVGQCSAGANCTVVGALTLTATLASIDVRQAFAGDANANNSVVLYYRPAGSSATTWRNAYTPYTDRRALIDGVPNPYANQFRGSIVGLSSNTAYEVMAVVSDPEGKGGTVTGSVSTVNPSPTLGGTLRTVTNDATLATALGAANPGDTIHLNAGTYAHFTVSRPGTSGAWINIEGENAGTSIVAGTSTTQNILVSTNYIILQHLTLSASDASGIIVSASQHDLIIQNNNLQNIDANCATFSGTNPRTDYGYAGINIGDGASNVFVLSNTVHSAALDALSCTCAIGGGCGADTTIFDSPAIGIAWSNITTLVVDHNTVDGGFRDAISSDSSSLVGQNVDLSSNTVNDYKDDGIESKGGNVNARLWGNIITADIGGSCLAGNTNILANRYGPLYIFRNTCRVTSASLGETVYKMDGAPMYLLHNSVDSSPSVHGWSTLVTDGTTNVIAFFNNISKGSGTMYDSLSASVVTLDYNLDLAATGFFAFRWNGSTTYNTYSDYRTGTGQDAHSLNSDPSFSDTALHIGSGSPAVDMGRLIDNFNTIDSAWPFTGSAPDMGAYER